VKGGKEDSSACPITFPRLEKKKEEGKIKGGEKSRPLVSIPTELSGGKGGKERKGKKVARGKREEKETLRILEQLKSIRLEDAGREGGKGRGKNEKKGGKKKSADSTSA